MTLDIKLFNIIQEAPAIQLDKCKFFFLPTGKKEEVKFY